MIIHFSDDELAKLQIQPVERFNLSAAYLEEREEIWTAQMNRVQSRNGHMWNGEVYALNEIIASDEDQVTFRLSTCEYKDLIFRMLKGDSYITAKYGEEYLFRFMGVSCVPMTRDGKFVFGIRSDRPEMGTRPVGGIGGTLNKDESLTSLCSN